MDKVAELVFCFEADVCEFGMLNVKITNIPVSVVFSVISL